MDTDPTIHTITLNPARLATLTRLQAALAAAQSQLGTFAEAVLLGEFTSEELARAHIQPTPTGFVVIVPPDERVPS